MTHGITNAALAPPFTVCSGTTQSSADSEISPCVTSIFSPFTGNRASATFQDSQNVFSVQLTDTDLLLDTYPFLEGKLSGAARDFASYVSDEAVDLSEKTAVIDWYYKKRQGGAHRSALL